MIDLIHIYDAVEELNNASDIAVGYGEGILGELNRVSDVIANNSPIYDEHQDFSTQRLGQVLNNRDISADERVRILLGIKCPHPHFRYMMLYWQVWKSEKGNCFLWLK